MPPLIKESKSNVQMCPIEDDGPLISRVRLFDGIVHLYVESDGGSEVEHKVIGELDRDIDFGAIPAEHWKQVEAWIEEQEDDRRYGRDCRAEQLRRY